MTLVTSRSRCHNTFSRCVLTVQHFKKTLLNSNIMSSQATVLIKVRYPPTSPIASKTFNLDSTLTVRKAIMHIVDQVKSGLSASHAGLYVKERNLWLDENKPLLFYADLLKQVDGVEFKDKTQRETNTAVILGVAVGALLVGVASTAVYFRRFK